jgi:protein angel
LDLSAVHIDEYFFDRPNVAILALLKDKVNQHHVLVINTHLLFNNRRGDIKLLQIQSILAAARTIINGLGAANVSLVWTGDFNLIPNSPIYDYLRTGCLNVSTADIKKVPN